MHEEVSTDNFWWKVAQLATSTLVVHRRFGELDTSLSDLDDFHASLGYLDAFRSDVDHLDNLKDARNKLEQFNQCIVDLEHFHDKATGLEKWPQSAASAAALREILDETQGVLKELEDIHSAIRQL